MLRKITVMVKEKQHIAEISLSGEIKLLSTHTHTKRAFEHFIYQTNAN